MPDITRLNIMMLACLCRHWLTRCHQDDELGNYLSRWCPAGCSGPHASENLSGFWLKVSTLLFSLRSQARSRESGTAENSDKKVAFWSRSGLSWLLLFSISNLDNITCKPLESHLFIRSLGRRVSTALGGFGLGFTTLPLLVNIPLTTLFCRNDHWIFIAHSRIMFCSPKVQDFRLCPHTGDM